MELPCFTFVLEKFSFVLGFLATAFVVTFLVLSSPVYLYRFFVRYFFAPVFRPDLSEMLTGQCSAMAADFLSNRPPRANVVVALIIQGQTTLQEIQGYLQQSWIDDADKYPKGEFPFRKFMCYPVSWMGFKFWKPDKNFNIKNHVYQLTTKKHVVTEQELEILFEKLLNEKFVKDKSPWQFHHVHNYQPNYTDNTPHSVLLFKFHHGMVDGFSILQALLTALVKDYTPDQIQLPHINLPKRSLLQKVCFSLAFPFNLFLELSQVLKYWFYASNYQIRDNQKAWKLLYVRTPIVPIRIVKEIKNHFGVSFTSVLLTAISYAIYRNQLEKKKGNRKSNWEKSMLVCTILPLPKHQVELTNYVTSALFELPIDKFESEKERLHKVDEMLRKKMSSVFPLLFHKYTSVFGSHVNPVAKAVLSNKFVPFGISNMAGVPRKFGRGDRTCVGCYASAAPLDGDGGGGFLILSHDQDISIQACLEQALMDKPEARRMMSYVVEEIYRLHEFARQKMD